MIKPYIYLGFETFRYEGSRNKSPSLFLPLATPQLPEMDKYANLHLFSKKYFKHTPLDVQNCIIEYSDLNINNFRSVLAASTVSAMGFAHSCNVNLFIFLVYINIFRPEISFSNGKMRMKFTTRSSQFLSLLQNLEILKNSKAQVQKFIALYFTCQTTLDLLNCTFVSQNSWIYSRLTDALLIRTLNLCSFVLAQFM